VSEAMVENIQYVDHGLGEPPSANVRARLWWL